MSNLSTGIMHDLKNESFGHHATLESLPYFKTLIEHRLPLECYVNQLGALRIIHGVLETQLASSGTAAVVTVWNDSLRKLPLLEADLDFFSARVTSSNGLFIQVAQEMASHIRLRAIENPISLLGYLYVLEGSTLGNRLHQPDLRTSFCLDGIEGSRYYASYRDQVKSRWEVFSAAMNKALSSPQTHAPVIEAAHEAFAGLVRLYKVLYPPSRTAPSGHVTRINPEAGNHPIPDDQREIDAALAASSLCWKEFPYYEHRYGQRGKRFSDSDTCWLATLTAMRQDRMQRQIDWLCRVLAARGMPSLMMEYALGVLHKELAKAVPEKSEAYQKLRVSADCLKMARMGLLDENRFLCLGRQFDRKVGPAMATKFKNTGLLLVASIVDEKNGISGSKKALIDWLSDANMFSSRWIEAIDEIVQKAEALVS